MLKKTILAMCASLIGLSSGAAHAAILDAPVPVNATVTKNGFQWAWAAPVVDVDLSYQSQFGWRLPTAAELLLAPSGFDFKFSGANVPLGGNDPVSGANFQYTAPTLDSAAALATPYFSISYKHGDWCNAPGSGCGLNNEQPWNGPPSYAEALVLRAVGGVPEPATWALMMIGIGAVGASMRQSKRRTMAFARLA